MPSSSRSTRKQLLRLRQTNAGRPESKTRIGPNSESLSGRGKCRIASARNSVNEEIRRAQENRRVKPEDRRRAKPDRAKGLGGTSLKQPAPILGAAVRRRRRAEQERGNEHEQH